MEEGRLGGWGHPLGSLAAFSRGHDPTDLPFQTREPWAHHVHMILVLLVISDFIKKANEIKIHV